VVETPLLRPCAGVLQALERNADLDFVSLLGAPPLGVPEVVHVEVVLAAEETAGAGARLAPEAVFLDAESVYPEERGAAPVVEGVG
jgi:hypothetical protein